MGGDILPSYTERIIKETQKELIAAVKDMRNGAKPAGLKEKYPPVVIKNAKKVEKLCNS